MDMQAIWALVLWALGIWGWSGITFEVRPAEMALAAAITTPAESRTSFTIDLDPWAWAAADEDQQRRRILHEVGHGVGYFNRESGADPLWRDHSDDPASVMYPYYAPGQQVLPADRLLLLATTRYWQPYKAVVPGLAR